MTRTASIDIGSQTIRLLIADCSPPNHYVPVFRDRRIVRLGEGMNARPVLSRTAMDRAARCLSDFASTARSMGAVRIYAVATACVRNALNAPAFLKLVQLESGLSPAVLSGNDEAALSLKGVLSVYPRCSGPALVMDIGGGSTEFTSLPDSSTCISESIDLGVIGLSETFLLHDPPSRPEVRNLAVEVDHRLRTASRTLHSLSHSRPSPLIIGTAGTITTLAAMDLRMAAYYPDIINGHCLSRSSVERLFSEMVAVSSEKRRYLPGLEHGRETVIIPGAVIVLSVMDIVRTERLSVSDAGLLEGVIIQKINSPP